MNDNGDKVPNTQERWDSHWTRFSLSTRANPGHVLRRRLIARLLGPAAASSDATILDFGCGSGDLLAGLAARFPEATLAGVDLSQKGLGETAAQVPKALLRRFDFNAAEGVPDELRGWATHVVCSEVLEHLDDPLAALRNAALCLKPGGKIVITVPGGPMSAFDRHIGHCRHFTRTSMKDLLDQAGLPPDIVAAAGFPAYNLYRTVVLLRGRRLIEDVSGEPGMLAALVMAVFRGVIGLSLFDSPWGWQIVASAKAAKD